MSNYLQLVNKSIIFSGADLDEIAQADFTNRSDSMQRKFKTYVRDAWYELQMEINNWEFKSKQAQYIIRPRFLVQSGDGTGSPSGVMLGSETGASFEIVDVVLLDGLWATGTAVANVEYKDLDGQFKWNELYEPAPGNVDDGTFLLKWWGNYDLNLEGLNVFEPITTTFYIQSTGGGLFGSDDSTATADNGPLVYVPWVDFMANGFEADQVSRGRPQYITERPDGSYDFWPRPDLEYVLTFTYSSTPQELSAYDDEPEDLPIQYHDIIAWKAVMFWADFQERPSQFVRAERRYETLMNTLSKNQKPKPTFSPSPFNQDYIW